MRGGVGVGVVLELLADFGLGGLVGLGRQSISQSGRLVYERSCGSGIQSARQSRTAPVGGVRHSARSIFERRLVVWERIVALPKR
ncbi:hypothetical protein T492DRAFT_976282 [Pavlovales sp. CCMP2436]|nr:hypothetical protein T492DRAFT_976282 [Pavlovales sp. CCMP2436]